MLREVKHGGFGSGVKEAVVCMTFPLWLTEAGEIVPEGVAHETMCKPEDVEPVALPEDPEALSRLAPLFLTYEEGREAHLAAEGLREEELEGLPVQPGTLAHDVEKAVEKLIAKPIWSMIFTDLHTCAFGHLDQGAPGEAPGDAEVYTPVERCAAQFYLSIHSANAANTKHISDSLGVKNALWGEQSKEDLNKRLVNFHVPHWLHGPMRRGCITGTMAVSDSIPVSMKCNMGGLSEALLAAFYHSFLPCNRTLFRYVGSSEMRIVIDSCSDVKLATCPYEVGASDNLINLP